MENEALNCPNCNSKLITKRGFRITDNRNREKIQRYFCKTCHNRFVLDNPFFRMRNKDQMYKRRISGIKGSKGVKDEYFIDVLDIESRYIVLALKHIQPCNNLMLSIFMGLPINSITPRMNELRKKGIVIYYKTEACPFTKRASNFYKIKSYINECIPS